MPALCQGSIVWATVLDPEGGNPKPRPIVIISRDDEIAEGDVLIGVAASHSATFGSQLPPGSVALPHHPQGAVRTGLRKPTVAIPGWLVEVAKADIRDIAGVVPPLLLEEIVRRAIAPPDSSP